jgi:hypothetical protein
MALHTILLKYFVCSDVLSGEGQSVHSPRFSPNGEYLVWLQRPSGGPHHAAQKLVCYKWNLQQVCGLLLYNLNACSLSVLLPCSFCGF